MVAAVEVEDQISAFQVEAEAVVEVKSPMK